MRSAVRRATPSRRTSSRAPRPAGTHPTAAATRRRRQATVDAMAHERREATIAGLPVGPATMRLVLVCGAAGFFAALYSLSIHMMGAQDHGYDGSGGGR